MLGPKVLCGLIWPRRLVSLRPGACRTLDLPPRGGAKRDGAARQGFLDSWADRSLLFGAFGQLVPTFARALSVGDKPDCAVNACVGLWLVIPT